MWLREKARVSAVFERPRNADLVSHIALKFRNRTTVKKFIPMILYIIVATIIVCGFFHFPPAFLQSFSGLS